MYLSQLCSGSRNASISDDPNVHPRLIKAGEIQQMSKLEANSLRDKRKIIAFRSTYPLNDMCLCLRIYIAII